MFQNAPTTAPVDALGTYTLHSRAAFPLLSLPLVGGKNCGKLWRGQVSARPVL